MRCGKQEHQPGHKCPAKNAKCKSCHKIGHFHCVCMSKKRAKQQANLVQTQDDDDDNHINENGIRQPNPPRVNMLKTVNHIEANLKPEHKPARHAPRKVPIHLEDAFRQEIKSLMDQGILEEVKEHTDWVNSYVIVETDTGNHHSPNHTIKRKLRICLDPRDLNQALEREPYHTCSIDEITAKLQGMTVSP